MNTTVTLLRYASVESLGWRRGAVVRTKNGKIKPDVMTISGREVYCPNGRYQMRRYQGKLPVYVELGTEPTDALNRFLAEESKSNARVVAKAAGLEIVSAKNEPQSNATRKTLKQHAFDFMQMHRNLPHRSGDSVAVYSRITSTFLSLCKATYPSEVTQGDVIRWHGWMRKEKKYNDRTCSNYYKSLRGFLNYCGVKTAAIIGKGQHKMLKLYTKKTVNTYTPETVQNLIEASTDSNRALLWDFAYRTGLRDSELQAVTRYDLHNLDTEPMLHVKERDEYGRIKDAEEREVELHSALVPRLREWLKEHPTKVLLFGTDNDKQDTKMLLALKVTARRAGLNCGRCKGCRSERNECREFTLHRFRRTYVTRMLRATGGDLRSVMARSGHSDLPSVMRYLEPAAQIRTAVEQGF